jgi:hypothetical protein
VILPLAVVTTLAVTCAPQVAPVTLAAIAQTESGLDPFAIGDNTAHRSYHPAAKPEAIALTAQLAAEGHDLDLGLMQINQRNFGWLGLAGEDAFEPCRSLAAGAAVLTAFSRYGAVIPCTLQTAINSQLMGFVDCVLPAEVRGATGTVTLLDRGTEIFGEIRSGLRQGQDRLFILWVRARTPENVVVSLTSPAADELGRAGVPGAVDNHFWQRFGAAILFSVIGYGPQIAANAVQHGNGNNYIQFLTPQQELANTVLEAQINIPPTLEKNQGETVSIFVARDLDFSSVYDLRAQP